MAFTRRIEPNNLIKKNFRLQNVLNKKKNVN